MVEDKTTVEVTAEVWAAMDKRKSEDETFDEFVRRLIDNTAIPMGKLKSMDKDTPPNLKYGKVERIKKSDMKETKGCLHYDSIDGICGNEVEYKQEYFIVGNPEPNYFYYCEEHAPTESTDE